MREYGATAALKRRVAREVMRYSTGRVVHPELEDVTLFVEVVLDWSSADFDESASLLLFLLDDPASRDAVLLQWSTDFEMGDRLWRHLRLPPGENPEWDQLLANLRVGIGPPPDGNRLDRQSWFSTVSPWLPTSSAGGRRCRWSRGPGGPGRIGGEPRLAACSIRSLKN